MSDQYRVLDESRDSVSHTPPFSSSSSSSASSSASSSSALALEGEGSTSSTSSSSASSTTPGTNGEVGSGTSGGGVTLRFRTLTGQLLSLSVASLQGLTVNDIKHELELQHGIPAAFQRLIFGGRELADTSFASECNITDGACVHLLLRQNPPAQPSAPILDNNNSNNNNVSAAPHPSNFPQQPFPYPGFAVMGENGAPNMIAIGMPIGGGLPPPVPNAAPINADQLDRMTRLFQLGRAVKMFAIIDGIFLVLWSFQLWYLAFGVLLAMCGFYGARLYRPLLVGLYLLYILASIGVRIWWIIGPPMPSTLWIFLLVIGIIIEVYIASIAFRFITLARILSDRERAELLAMQQPVRPVFF